MLMLLFCVLIEVIKLKVLTFSNLLASISLVSLFSQLFAYDDKRNKKKLKGRRTSLVFYLNWMGSLHYYYCCFVSIIILHLIITIVVIVNIFSFRQIT